MAESKPTNKLTDEERLQLADKLDKELDAFIDSLPKRKREELPPIEELLAELDSHPFFMKKAPEIGDKLHPLLEGLQQLKYDPNENSAHDLAETYKEDGNWNFKHKKYRLAVLSYSEGIKQKSGDCELDATLLNNRAAAHYYLENYGSCLKDCDAALKIKPTYTKCLTRAARSAEKLAKHDAAIAYCDTILEADANNTDIANLRQQCVVAKKTELAQQRKAAKQASKQARDDEELLQAINQRGIRFDTSVDLINLTPKFNELAQCRVKLDGGVLVWPVVFMYPEYGLIEFVQEFAENVTFEEQFNEIFKEYAEWDVHKCYKPENLQIYFENKSLNRLFNVNIQSTLAEILQHKLLIVSSGSPCFLIAAKNTPFMKKFLEKYICTTN